MRPGIKQRIGASAFAAALAVGLAAPTAFGHAQGEGLFPSNWTCDDLGAVVFLLPPVLSEHAPYPGFLEPDGTTWVVEGVGPIGGPITLVGQKTGLGAGQICVSTDFGVEVLVAPTGN